MQYIIQLPIILALLFCVPIASASPKASLEHLSGTVELQRNGQDFFKQARIGQNVTNGDILRTGVDGKATIRLVDDSILSFAAETEFMLGSELAGVSTEDDLIGTLFRGITRAILKKRKGSYIKTPTGAVGIRGTDITLTHTGETGFYFLDEGAVEVGTDETTIPLDAGNMTASYANRKPLPPSPFTKATGLAKARSTLSALTSIEIPPSLKDHAKLNEILARWIINYAHYLADSGRHEDAETALLIAEDITKCQEVQGEILLQIGGLYVYRLNDVHGALRAYRKILREYQDAPYFEKALFGAVRCFHLLKQQDKAVEYTKWYKKKFPHGKYIHELDALMQ